MANAIIKSIRNLFQSRATQSGLGVVTQASSLLSQQHNLVESEMARRRKLWKQLYINQAPWLVPTKIYSANLAAIACGEVARLIALNFQSEVTGEPENNRAVNEVYTREILWDIRNQVEYGLAFGGLIIKPYISNGVVHVAFMHPEDFEIIAVDTDGSILEVYFKDYEKIGDAYIVRVEYHTFERENGTVTITNSLYRADQKGMLTSLINDTAATLQSIKRWSGLQEEQVLHNIRTPLFGAFKPATSNSHDPSSPYGVSIFDKAIPSIELADRQLSALIREFKVKEGRLYVDRLAIDSKASIPHLDNDFYVKMEVDSKQGHTFFEVFSPEIRTDDFLRVFNKYQQLVEDSIGLMHGTFSTPDVADRTATEVRESKHRTYSLVSANQVSLQRALEDAVYTIAVYLGVNPDSIEVLSVWDDSLLKDPHESMITMAEDVAAGLIRPELYLAKKYKVSEAEALSMMPTVSQLLQDNDFRVPNDGGGE